jgi:hypothetical protein
MIIQIANGNPIIAVVLISLSTFKESSLAAAFDRVSLSFMNEEVANQFVEEVKHLGCNGSGRELNDVVVIPDYSGSRNMAKAIYHAVDSYKDSLLCINRFEIPSYSEEMVNKSFQDIIHYINEHFGSNSITVQ